MHKVQKKYKKYIKELVKTTVRLGDIGYVTSHGGNLSYRVDEDTVLITPTKVPKKNVCFDDIVIVNFSSKILFAAGDRKPTGELPIHLNLLRKRPDIKGLVHAHPPVVTGFAIAGNGLLSKALLPEPIIELGPVLDVEYKEPLSDELATAFDKVIDKSNAFLMKNHGIMICSSEGVLRALELLEMVESMAYSVFVAAGLGNINEIPADEVVKLEKTIQTRTLPMPGKPGAVKSLKDIF